MRQFLLLPHKQLPMKQLLLIISIALFATSCKKENGYTCDVYSNTNQFKEVKKLGVESFKDNSYVKGNGATVVAIDRYNMSTSSGLRADSAVCKKTHIARD